MILVLFGPPGSGKGTQAEFLKREYGVYHFSTGAYLRELAAAGDEEVAKVMQSGALLPDERVTTIILDKLQSVLSEKPSPRVILLDGYPRSLAQANALLSFCRKEKEECFVLSIKVDENKLRERLMSRFTCKKCGAPFCVYQGSSQSCPFCGSNESFRRSDDFSEDVIKERLANYNNISSEVVGFFDSKKVFIIDGDSDINSVKGNVFKVVDGLLRENV